MSHLHCPALRPPSLCSVSGGGRAAGHRDTERPRLGIFFSSARFRCTKPSHSRFPAPSVEAPWTGGSARPLCTHSLHGAKVVACLLYPQNVFGPLDRRHLPDKHAMPRVVSGARGTKEKRRGPRGRRFTSLRGKHPPLP